MSSGNIERFYPFLNPNGAQLNFIVDAIDGLRKGVVTILDVSGNISVDKGKINLATGALTGILPVANGGTGSSTQNWVDLTTTQSSIAGAKTFTSAFQANSGIGLGAAPVASLLDARAVSATIGGAATSGDNVGDKIALYGSSYGFGIQSSALVAYYGSGAKFSFRTAQGSGAASGGTEVAYVNGVGNILGVGRLIAGADFSIGLAGDITASRISSAPTAALYLGNGGNYLFYDGTKFQLSQGLLITGALSGVTSLTMAGALSGVTTLGMGGALSGVTSLAMAGALSGATDITGSGIITGGIVKATGAPSLGSSIGGRFIGVWSTSGPPTGMTGIVGDHGFDGKGTLYYCTVAGTPGTWTAASLPRLGLTAQPYQVQFGFTTGATIPAGSPGSVDITLPTAWPTSHLVFMAAVWPLTAWSYIAAGGGPFCTPSTTAKGTVALFANTGQTYNISWISIGY